MRHLPLLLAAVLALGPLTPVHAEEMEHMGHAMAGVLGLGHAREASGTSWQPDATPVHGDHFMVGTLMLMAHYELSLAFDQMYGPRGSSAAFSTNWGMVMARQSLAGGFLQGRAMLSLEPLTVPARGYPLLLQTGEAYQGQALHDVQHPHNLFMELSVGYARELGRGIAAQLYLAPVGEPALGPTAFPHRESASFSPLAPITHHHLDSTHISFGVVTAAIFTRTLKLDASAFNGREASEHRWGFDPVRLDSVSARLSWAPCPGFVGQLSAGHLHGPEELAPGVNEDRFTASATIDHRFAGGNLASTLAVAQKRTPGHASTGVLFEANLDADGTSNVFTRFELAQRGPEDLALPAALGDRFDVAEVTVGYLAESDPIGEVQAGLGIAGMLAFVPTALETTYGGSAAPGFMVFLRLRPAKRL